MSAIHTSTVALGFALLFTAAGQLLFKMYYVRVQRGYLVAALATFLLVPVFSYFALLNLTLSLVYMSTALTHVLVLVLSYFFLNERFSRKQYASVMLIVLGIFVFNC